MSIHKISNKIFIEYLAPLLFTTLFSCQNQQNHASIKNKTPKTTSASQSLPKDSNSVKKVTMLISAPSTSSKIISPGYDSSQVLVVKSAAGKEQIKENSASAAEASPTIMYYYGTKIASTITTPWMQGYRYIRLYDRKGNLTYEFKDERKSYSITTTLRYREDGSVAAATIATNPDASMYWYSTSVSVNESNDPVEMQTTQYPQQSISALDGNPVLYWDKSTQKWIKK